jgi:hypothetical protein
VAETKGVNDKMGEVFSQLMSMKLKELSDLFLAGAHRKNLSQIDERSLNVFENKWAAIGISQEP